MGDISVEPSMEDILSSIKRIIAEDGEGGQPSRIRRGPRSAPDVIASPPADAEEEAEVLELSDFAPEVAPAPVEAAERESEPAKVDSDPEPTPLAAAEPIVSHDALASSRGSLNALTKAISKPETDAIPAGDGRSMEAFVADLLRPMLREWLDANLPELVEAMVAKEIARITNSR